MSVVAQRKVRSTASDAAHRMASSVPVLACYLKESDLWHWFQQLLTPHHRCMHADHPVHHMYEIHVVVRDT